MTSDDMTPWPSRASDFVLRTFIYVAVCVTSVPGFAQAPLAFDVASIKVNNSGAIVLAAQLSARVGRSVVDRTGLSGRFDLDVEFAPPPPPGSSADPAAVDGPADAAPSIFTAIQEQLGLKLEPQKGTVEVTVIDSAERLVEH
jgi:Protein of unknown function (DUF3738)